MAENRLETLRGYAARLEGLAESTRNSCGLRHADLEAALRFLFNDDRLELGALKRAVRGRTGANDNAAVLAELDSAARTVRGHAERLERVDKCRRRLEIVKATRKGTATPADARDLLNMLEAADRPWFYKLEEAVADGVGDVQAELARALGYLQDAVGLRHLGLGAYEDYLTRRLLLI
jgi:hypothetical protein